MLFDPVLPDGTVVAHPTPRSWYAFAALAAGLSAGRWLGGVPSSAWFSVAAGLCALALLSRGWWCRASAFAAVAALGAGWFTARLLEPSADSILRRVPGEGAALVHVEGVVLDSPRRTVAESDPLALPVHEDAWRLRLRVTAIEGPRGMEPASERTWVRLGGSRPSAPAMAGDRVAMEGLFTPNPAPMNPGELDRRLWAGQEGYCGRLQARDLTRLEGGGGVVGAVESGLLRWRAWLSDRAHGLLLGDDADAEASLDRGASRPPSADFGDAASARQRQGRALLAALILGDDDPELREARGAFNRLGLAHILSISGFHLAVLAAVALLALRAFGDLGWREPALVAVLVVAYLAILPYNAPVWRSGLMVLGLLGADAAGRRYSRLATLGWIAVALLIWRPMDLWSMGFQLSFGLVAVLLWMGDSVDARLWGRPLKGTVPVRRAWWHAPLRMSKTAVSTNLLCCAIATPLVMCQTGLVSVLAVISGLIVLPLISLLLIAGYAGAALGALIPGVSGVTGSVLAAAAGWVAWLVERLDGTPWSSLRSPPVSALWAAAATAALLYCFARGHLRDRWAWGATVVVALWAGAGMWAGARLPARTVLRIDTLAVGDGTCQIMRSGREALLWDCGSLAPGVGRMLVPSAARALGAWRTATAVVTHPNIDHFNGLLDVVEPLGIRRVLIGEAFAAHAAEHPRSPESYVLAELRRRSVEVRVVSAGERIAIGEATLEFLSPPAGAAWPQDNDLSLVALVTAADRPAALLCGDIQGQAMEWIRSRHPRLRVPILEAPHHGSARDPAYDFVSALGPRVVLQSTGPSRAGDDRWEEVRRGRTWWCTALDGAAWAEVERDGSVRSGAFRR